MKRILASVLLCAILFTTLAIGGAGNLATPSVLDADAYPQENTVIQNLSGEGESGITLSIPNKDTVQASLEGISSGYTAPTYTFSGEELSGSVVDGGTVNTAWYTGETNSYEITTAEQLRGFFKLRSEGETFEGDVIKLGADIKMDKTKTIPAATGNFAGTFDGGIYNESGELTGYHVIDGLYLSSTTATGLSFFGPAAKTAKVQNVEFVNCLVKVECLSGTQATGGFAGIFQSIAASGAQIVNVYNDIDLDILSAKVTKSGETVTAVSNASRYVGGFVGLASKTQVTISGCVYAGELTASAQDVGGFIGCIAGSTAGKAQITNCENRGTLVSYKKIGTVDCASKAAHWGGFVGYLQQGGTVTIQSSATTADASIDAYTSVGGFIGRMYANYSSGSTTISITNCVNNATLTGNNTVGGAVGQVRGNEPSTLPATPNTQVLNITGFENNGEIQSTGNYAGGCIGFVSNEKNTATVSKITLKNVVNNQTVTGKENVAGLVGFIRGYNAAGKGDFTSFENAVNKGTVNGTGYVGGLVGRSHNGKLTFKTLCGNLNTVTATAAVAGGIVGWQGSGNASLDAQKCYNLGAVSSTTGQAAGIVGFKENTSPISLQSCYNYAAIQGALAGGIIGQSNQGPFTISNCGNEGTVTATSTWAGGIAGDVLGSYDTTKTDNKRINISDCVNLGTVTGVYGVGGIIGTKYASSGTTCEIYITRCQNGGAVSATGDDGSDDHRALVGGIMGYLGSNEITGPRGAIIENCYNEGAVGAVNDSGAGTNRYVGGVIGAILTPGSAPVTITGCTNNAPVKGVVRVGGIVGAIKAESTTKAPVVIDKCYNKGAVDTTASASGTAGILGYLEASGANGRPVTVSNCYNQGVITSLANYVGGIVGRSQSLTKLVITNCHNEAAVNGKAGTGGILGQVYQTNSSSIANVVIENCTNTVAIVATGPVGGIMGSMVGTSKDNNTKTHTFQAEGETEAVSVNVTYSTYSPCYATLEIKGCKNTGTVTGTGVRAGILGQTTFIASEGGVTLEDCNNSGNIKAANDTFLDYAAGICANISMWDAPVRVKNCDNSGNIEMATDESPALNKGIQVGGILGYVRGEIAQNLYDADYFNSKKDAVLNATTDGYKKGLKNESHYMTKLEVVDCDNTGDIQGNRCTGGLIGYAQRCKGMLVYNCSVDADITATLNAASNINVGGLIARINMENDDCEITIDKCKVEGNLDVTVLSALSGSSHSNVYCGGLIGELYYGKAYATDCHVGMTFDMKDGSETQDQLKETDRCSIFIGNIASHGALTNPNGLTYVNHADPAQTYNNALYTLICKADGTKVSATELIDEIVPVGVQYRLNGAADVEKGFIEGTYNLRYVFALKSIEDISVLGFDLEWITVTNNVEKKVSTTVYTPSIYEVINGKDANDNPVEYRAEDYGAKYLFTLTLANVNKDAVDFVETEYGFRAYLNNTHLKITPFVQAGKEDPKRVADTQVMDQNEENALIVTNDNFSSTLPDGYDPSKGIIPDLQAEKPEEGLPTLFPSGPDATDQFTIGCVTAKHADNNNHYKLTYNCICENEDGSCDSVLKANGVYAYKEDSHIAALRYHYYPSGRSVNNYHTWSFEVAESGVYDFCFDMRFKDQQIRTMMVQLDGQAYDEQTDIWPYLCNYNSVINTDATSSEFESTYMSGYSAYLEAGKHTITIRYHYDTVHGAAHLRNIFLRQRLTLVEGEETVVDAAHPSYGYTAEEDGTVRLTAGALTGAEGAAVELKYSVNGGAVTALALDSFVDLALQANDVVAVWVTTATGSTVVSVRPYLVDGKDALIDAEHKSYMYIAEADGAARLSTSSTVEYSVNGAEATTLESGFVDLTLTAGDVLVVKATEATDSATVSIETVKAIQAPANRLSFELPEKFKADGVIFVSSDVINTGVTNSVQAAANKQWYLYTNPATEDASAHGVSKLAANNACVADKVYHYYIDLAYANKTQYLPSGVDTITYDTAYIRYSFEVTEAGFYQIASHHRSRTSSDRNGWIQIDNGVKHSIDMPKVADTNIYSSATGYESIYFEWNETFYFEEGTHTITYTLGNGKTSSIHWRDLWLLKVAD